MKKLVALAIAVIAAIAIVVYFGRSTEPTLAPASKPEQLQTRSAEPAVAHASEPEQPQVPLTREADAQRTNPAIAQPSPAPESGPAIATRATREEQQRDVCDQLSERKQKREQLARDSETKDPPWAYPMEQKLREYAARRFQPAQIEVTEIDCKTSFCEINAQSSAPGASEAFNEAIGALLRWESWHDFTGYSVSLAEEAGKTIHIARVTRKGSIGALRQDPEEEKMQQACFAWVNERDARERAARDAEPRDASWADPSEQMLRQYITGQPAKHPIKELEINCKSTFCEIKATGRTPESYAAFQKAAQEAASEPWSDVHNGSGGGQFGDEDWKQYYHVYRREPTK